MLIWKEKLKSMFLLSLVIIFLLIYYMSSLIQIKQKIKIFNLGEILGTKISKSNLFKTNFFVYLNFFLRKPI